MEEKSVMELYTEAISFFQKYPDQWKALRDGLVAKRNIAVSSGFVKMKETAAVERGNFAIGVLSEAGIIDEIVREFIADYSQPEPSEES